MIYIETLCYFVAMLVFCFIIGSALCSLLSIDSRVSFSVLAGFLFVTAVLQLVATPFMLTRGRFDLFADVFLVLCAIFFGIFIIYHIKNKDLKAAKIKLPKSQTLILGITGILILLQMILSMYLQHTDDDDGFYITVTTSAIKSNIIFGFDPSVGSAAFPFPMKYGLVSWELGIGAVSKLTGIPTAVLAHTVMVPFLIFLSYLAVDKLALRLAMNKSAVSYFMLLYSALNLFGSYHVYSQASFLLLRIWQGKSILANVVIPALLFAFADIAANKQNNRSKWLFITIVLLSGTCVSVAGVYLIPVLYICLFISYQLFHNNHNKKRAWSYFLMTLTPCVIYTVVNIMISYAPHAKQSSSDLDYFEIIKAFSGRYLIITALFIAGLVYIFVRCKRLQKIVLFYPSVFLFLTLLNPITGILAGRNPVINPVYWRLFWLLPIYPAISLFLSDAIISFNRKTIRYSATALCCALIAFGGVFMYNKDNFSIPENKYKLPQQVIDIAKYIKADGGEGSSVLLPEYYSAKLRQYDAGLIATWSRYAYVKDDFSISGGAANFSRLSSLYYQLYSGDKSAAYKACKIIGKYHIRYIVLPACRDIFKGNSQSGLIFRTYLDQYIIYENERA